MGLRVLFLAARKTGFDSLRYVIERGEHKVVGVFSMDYEQLVNDGITTSDFEKFLNRKHIPFWPTDTIHDIVYIEQIKNIAPDVGLSIGWRRLVKESVISLPRLGFINFHTSDLPKYRGFASTSWAIIKGDDKVAITAHKMEPAVADLGLILLKEYIPLTSDMDIGMLFRAVESIIPGMVHRLLDDLEQDRIQSMPQDENEAILSFPRRPSDGWIDWTKPAAEIDCLVRSISRPYPGAFTCWQMRKITVWKGYALKDHPAWVGVPGQVIGADDKQAIKVLTGDGIYVITEMQEGTKKIIPPAVLIRGVQQRLGLTQGELFEILSTIWQFRIEK